MLKPKLINRPNRIEMPTGTTCPDCKGSGVTQGAVSEYTCGTCFGLGLKVWKQPYFVDRQDALSSMCIAQRRYINELKRELAKHAVEEPIGSRFD